MPPLDSVPTYRYFSIVLHGSLRCYRGRHDSFLHAPFFLLCSLSLSLFISLPFCFAVVVFFRVLLFAVRCFVVDFFLGRWWLHGLIDRRHIMRRDIKIVFFGVLPSLIGVFFFVAECECSPTFHRSIKRSKIDDKKWTVKVPGNSVHFSRVRFFYSLFRTRNLGAL